jgi:hypothetical protein
MPIADAENTVLSASSQRTLAAGLLGMLVIVTIIDNQAALVINRGATAITFMVAQLANIVPTKAEST